MHVKKMWAWEEWDKVAYDENTVDLSHEANDQGLIPLECRRCSTKVFDRIEKRRVHRIIVETATQCPICGLKDTRKVSKRKK